MNVNYQKQYEKIISSVKNSGRKPTLLLHSCCAPCSTSVIDRLKDFFDLTVYYYNPNIYPEEEYFKRLDEQKRLCEIFNIPVIDEVYNPAEFYEAVKGRENDYEGGARCKICCGIRLERTAKKAKELGFEYFATTLSVSPLKNAGVLNETGLVLQENYGVNYLIADFKKKDGYLNSVRMSAQYGLYRQNFCGCEFSRNKIV